MAKLYQFDLAGRSYGLAIRNRHFYVLGDGQFLPVRVWPAWCECCRKFTAAELIFPVADEAKELEEVEYFAERPGLIPPDRHLPVRELPLLRVRMIWRAERRSPAKCLACGCSEITPIWPGPALDIPGRGKCVASFRGWMDTADRPDKYYSPEGERVDAPS